VADFHQPLGDGSAHLSYAGNSDLHSTLPVNRRSGVIARTRRARQEKLATSSDP
jgi:hypothetical protein